jgi:hypothetical protein
MLTDRAIEERKWGQFPELRKALLTSRVPTDYYGPTSVSDNLVSRLERLAEVAVIVKECRTVVEQAANPKNLRQIAEDLNRLEHELGFGIKFFKTHADFCAQFAEELNRQFQKVLSVPAGISYEFLLKHRIYSCPDSYKYESVRLISPRTAEGVMENIFTIRRILTADPEHLKQANLSDDDRSRIAAYISDAHPTGILKDDGEFRFYILDAEPTTLKHRPRPPVRLDGAHYFWTDRLTDGSEVVTPIPQ